MARGVRAWLADLPSTGVLVYLPMPGEVDVTAAVDGRHRWYVTRTPAAGAPLTIHPFDAEREMHPFGYAQPVGTAPVVDPPDVGVVLTPGLAFDRAGMRLGWGKGYYDRLFALMPSVVAVGITLDRLVVDEALPAEPHDRRMDALATESGVRPVEAEDG